jgi:tetratricopeptide (TPR) repeat protein
MILLAAAVAIGAGPAVEPSPVDWLLEDGLGEEDLRLEAPAMASPEELHEAFEDYGRGNYRLAATKLERLLALNLPDGRGDYIHFMLAECYRMLGLAEAAQERYRFVVERFAESKKCAPAYFRILQHGYTMRNSATADSVFAIFQTRYKIHPLYHSVTYVIGKLYFRTERYGEAQELLLQIPRRSSRHFQARFVAALALIKLDRIEKALLILESIRKSTLDETLRAEVGIVMGDIYLSREKHRPALALYRSVPEGAVRYEYALARTARILLHLAEYDKAAAIAHAFIDPGECLYRAGKEGEGGGSQRHGLREDRRRALPLRGPERAGLCSRYEGAVEADTLRGAGRG